MLVTEGATDTRQAIFRSDLCLAKGARKTEGQVGSDVRARVCHLQGTCQST